MKEQLSARASELIFQLRTLLGNTTGMLEVATSTTDRSEQADYLDAALGAAQQASIILNELLAPSSAASAAVAHSQDPLSQSLVSETETRKLKILLAEDNLINQRLVSKLLERRGHSVTIANNGKIAVDTAARDVFDLVLMDMKMPVMDGLDAASFIRADEKNSGRGRVPIVALTAVGEDELASIAEVMDEVIQKPFQTDRFMRTVETYAKRSPAVAK